MKTRITTITMCVAALLSLAACGRRPFPEALVFPPECGVLPAPEECADTITVALFDAVKPEYAPWALTQGERLLFGFLYETLVSVDCHGQVRGGLAESWYSGEGGRLWTFELDANARFWDGSRVTAGDVVTIWRHAEAAPTATSAVIDSAVADGEHTLRVYFRQRYRDVPGVLSEPAFAVAKLRETSRWPLGSGPYQVVASEPGPFGAARAAITTFPAFNRGGPIVQFVRAFNHDARDMLDGAIDVVVTADPDVIDYAADRPGFAAVPLQWERTYVLLSTSRAADVYRGGSPGDIGADLLDDLARDAVRGDARGFQKPPWWKNFRRRGEKPESSPGMLGEIPSPGPRRVLYDKNDLTARGLAERIVALAAAGSGNTSSDASGMVSAAEALGSAVPGLCDDGLPVVAEGVTRQELETSLWAGGDFAYIVSVSRRPHDPRYEAHKLLSRARWLEAVANDLPRVLVPLVDTRLHAIADKKVAGLACDWYGNVRIIISNEP